jgi:NAD(P)-dependent dehydrogenase (short-subunit alcohol dehydrogenase family)
MSPPLVLVTGSSDGIGKETAAQLCDRGARVILHGRDPQRLAAAAQEIDRRTGNWPVAQEVADLATLGEVRRFAARLSDHHPRIDVVINNAGVYMGKRVLTDDGFETTFAVNHLAGLALADALLPALRESPQGRVVFVSSGAHLSARLVWDTLPGEPREPAGARAEQDYDGFDAYALSKLANVMTAVELGRRLRGSTITVNACHPGVVATKLLRAGFGGYGTDSLQEAAATSVYLALAPELSQATGGYYARKAPARMHPVCSERALTARFYEKSCALADLRPLPPPRLPVQS